MEGISDELQRRYFEHSAKGRGGRKFWILNFLEPFGKIKGHVKFICVKRP